MWKTFSTETASSVRLMLVAMVVMVVSGSNSSGDEWWHGGCNAVVD